MATLLMLLAIVWSAVCCSTSKPFRHYDGFVWGTTFHITYASNVVLDDSIVRVMSMIDSSLSAFNPASCVSRVNRSECDKADSLMAAVLIESFRMNALSGGAFDPTIGPIVNLWGFGPDGCVVTLPSQERIDSALRYVGLAECSLLDDGTVVKKDSLTRFDFSSIAKGFGCDCIAKCLSRNGVTDFLIEIGGEVVAAGQSPRGSDWRVMIDAPIQSNDSVIHEGLAVIEISDGAIATSGDYRNYRQLDNGVVAAHIMNPATGYPVETNTLSVTVVAPECMSADALATVCMLLPLDSACSLIERLPDTEALFVTLNPGSNDWSTVATSGFPEIIK